MIKSEKAEEITRKIKRMGEENQVEDDWEKADKMAGLGYKINNRMFDKSKMDSKLVDPNKNFYKLAGENMQEFETIKTKAKSAKLTRRISKKAKSEYQAGGGAAKKIQFVKKSRAERKAKRSKRPLGRKMN